MRAARGGTIRLTLLALGLALGLASPARAFKLSFQGLGLASAGWTDNILSVPVLTSMSPPGAVGPQADWFFELRPSVALTTGAPRAIQRLAYAFDATLFASHSEANSYQNRVEWAGFFLPSKTIELLMNASLSQGRLNTFNLSQPTGATNITILPSGGVTYIGASALELLTWEFDPHWRFVQSLGFNAYAPIDPKLTPDTFEVDTHWMVERSLRKDAFGFDLRLDYATYTEVRGPVNDPACGMPGAPPTCDPSGVNRDGVVAPGVSQIISALVLKWRHDFGHFWNLELDAGALAVTPTNGSSSPVWQPTGMAAIRYLHPYVNGDLSYAHTVMPNTLVAQTFALDSVVLRAGVPFGQKSHVVLSASGGYQHGRIININLGLTAASTDVFLADATLAWQPRKEIGAFLRYSYFNQSGTTDADAAAAGVGVSVPTFARNTVMLGVNGVFPGDAAAVVPSRQALRVDKSDQPGIPEPHSMVPETAR
jgi:hypothetical protein